jgi:hypothetical protein
MGFKKYPEETLILELITPEDLEKFRLEAIFYTMKDSTVQFALKLSDKKAELCSSNATILIFFTVGA